MDYCCKRQNEIFVRKTKAIGCCLLVQSMCAQDVAVDERKEPLGNARRMDRCNRARGASARHRRSVPTDEDLCVFSSALLHNKQRVTLIVVIRVNQPIISKFLLHSYSLKDQITKEKNETYTR
jgi:hypothetical protein